MTEDTRAALEVIKPMANALRMGGLQEKQERSRA